VDNIINDRELLNQEKKEKGDVLEKLNKKEKEIDEMKNMLNKI